MFAEAAVADAPAAAAPAAAAPAPAAAPPAAPVPGEEYKVTGVYKDGKPLQPLHLPAGPVERNM